MSWLRNASANIMLGVVATLVLAQIAAFVILIPLASRVQLQAVAGQHARTIQCQVAPVGRKVYTDALRRGVITPHDFGVYTQVVTFSCPRP